MVLWRTGKRTPPRTTSWLVELSWRLSWFLRSVGTHLSCCRVSSSSPQWPEILEMCAILWWLPHLGHKQQLKSFMSLFCFPEVESRVFYFHYLAKILSPLRSMLFEYSSLYPLPTTDAPSLIEDLAIVSPSPKLLPSSQKVSTCTKMTSLTA